MLCNNLCNYLRNTFLLIIRYLRYMLINSSEVSINNSFIIEFYKYLNTNKILKIIKY